MSDSAGAPNDIGVIGGAGFIGKQLLPVLRRSARRVRVVDIVSTGEATSTDCFKADVRNLDQLVEVLRGCDQVINLAAVHRDDVRPLSLYHEVNVEGARNVCRAATQLGIQRILFTSSVAVYGLQGGAPDEAAAPRPINPYGQTKWQAEQVFREWQSAVPSERQLVIVRPTVVFGEGNRGNVYNLITQLSRTRYVMVGSGTNRKSMAYVRNVAEFLAYLALRPAKPSGMRVFNYCDTPDFDMNMLSAVVRRVLGKDPRPTVRLPYPVGIAIGGIFDLAAAATGRTFPVSKVRVEKFCANTVFSSLRAKDTGFQPSFSLLAALERTVRHEFAG
jgi:nucleoside-diphosphate-sugar epimerase